MQNSNHKINLNQTIEGKIEVKIRVKGRWVYLGTYDDENEAESVYLLAVRLVERIKY